MRVCVEIIIVYVTTCVVCVRGLIGEGCLSNVECVVCECARVCVGVCVFVCADYNSLRSKRVCGF